MCIYNPESDKLTYDGQEHVFPAGIGGIAVLPTEFVSKDFNNAMSKYEQDFLRNSILSIARTQLGPGKRGSLNSKNATKSKVMLILANEENSDFALGYSILKEIYEIPHIKANALQHRISFRVGSNFPDAVSNAFTKFKSDINQCGSLNIKKIKSKDLEEGVALFGIAPRIEENYDAFLFTAHEGTDGLTMDKLVEAVNSLGLANSSTHSYLPTMQGEASIKHDHLRVCGKIAFNFLAYSMGKEFVLRKEFDITRDWIGRDTDPVCGELAQKKDDPLRRTGLSIPKDSHYVLILKVRTHLLAWVCLYDFFCVVVTLSDNFQDEFEMKGLFCDWKNRTEFDYAEYIKRVDSGEFGTITPLGQM